MNSAEDSAKLKRNQVRVESDLGPEILGLGVDLSEKCHRSFFNHELHL